MTGDSKSTNVHLRLAAPADAGEIAPSLLAATDLHEWTTGHELPWGEQDLVDYLQRAADARRQRSGFVFSILCDDAIQGFVELNDVRWIHRTAKVGIFIWNDRSRSKGIGASAIRQVVDIAFSRLDLHRLWASIFASNERSRRLFAGAGFAEEGLLKEHAYVRGQREDVVVVGLLKRSSDVQL